MNDKAYWGNSILKLNVKIKIENLKKENLGIKKQGDS
jgi:hypothetical protein